MRAFHNTFRESSGTVYLRAARIDGHGRGRRALACRMPRLFSSGVLLQGFAPYAAVVGLFGMFCPVILFGLGAPHLSSGLSAIMASAELPMGLLISMIVLGIPLGIVEWTGVVVILIGVVIAQLPNLIPSLKR